jgi:hypothetical protein
VNDLAASLKSGVILCKFVNAIDANAVKKIDMRDLPLVYVENITAYLKACWKLGVPSQDTFVASDLINVSELPSFFFQSL